MNVIESTFPQLLRGGYEITSAQTPAYNCVAWALKDAQRWWWPDAFQIGYWPAGAPRSESLGDFLQTFALLGFKRTLETSVEVDTEKIAIYERDGRVSHVARQLPNGRWTSKLGRSEDIEHSIDGLSGDVYGTVVAVMARQL